MDDLPDVDMDDLPDVEGTYREAKKRKLAEDPPTQVADSTGLFAHASSLGNFCAMDDEEIIFDPIVEQDNDATSPNDELDPSAMNYRELQKACKDRGLTAVGKTEVLRKYLEDYLMEPEAALKQHGTRKGKATEEKGAKAKKAKQFDWAKSAAREILLEDLEQNGWLYGQDDLDAKIVFEAYRSQHEEFKDVPFTVFQPKYEAAIGRAAKRRARSRQEEEWMQHDRTIHPRQTHNHRGEPVFDMDEKAKNRLRKDVLKGVHERLTPAEMWDWRDVYQKYDLDIFRHRVYQEIRRNKFLNWLDWKRTEKRRKFAKDSEQAEQEITFARN